MSRQILVIKTDKTSDEIKNIMQNYLEKNNYTYKSYHGEEVLIKNTLPGFTSPKYMKVYVNNGMLKIVAWIKAFGKESGVDTDFVASVPKNELKRVLNEVVVLFNMTAEEVVNINTSEKVYDIQKNAMLRESEEASEIKFELNENMKSSAVVSAVLGLIMILVFFIPFPLWLSIVFTIYGIILGIRGIKSSLKVVSIIGIVLCSIDLIMYILMGLMILNVK